MLQHDVLHCGQRAEHRQVAHAVTVLGAVVVHEADRIEPQLRVAQQLLDDHLPGGAGADDQRATPVLEPAALPAPPDGTHGESRQ